MLRHIFRKSFRNNLKIIYFIIAETVFQFYGIFIKEDIFFITINSQLIFKGIYKLKNKILETNTNFLDSENTRI